MLGMLLPLIMSPIRANADFNDLTLSHKLNEKLLPRTILLDPSILGTVKEIVKDNNSNNTILKNALFQLISQANIFLTKKPTSVVDKGELPPSGDIHDFFSLAPYRWPDPSKKDGLP